jgi:hypothetical protein
MNKNKMQVFVLILLLAQAIYACPGFNKDDLIQVGVITYATPNSQNSRENCQSVAINYNVPNTGLQSALCNFLILFSRYRFRGIQLLQRN